MRCRAPLDPVDVLHLANTSLFRRGRSEPRTVLRHRPESTPPPFRIGFRNSRNVRHEVVAIARDRGIEINKFSDPTLDAISHSRDHHSRVGMPHQYNPLKLLSFDHTNH